MNVFIHLILCTADFLKQPTAQPPTHTTFFTVAVDTAYKPRSGTERRKFMPDTS